MFKLYKRFKFGPFKFLLDHRGFRFTGARVGWFSWKPKTTRRRSR